MKSVYRVQANKIPFFQNVCPQKTHPCHQCSSVKSDPDRYILRICYVYVYITMFGFLAKCVKNFLDDSVFMLAHKIKSQEKAAHM